MIVKDFVNELFSYGGWISPFTTGDVIVEVQIGHIFKHIWLYNQPLLIWELNSNNSKLMLNVLGWIYLTSPWITKTCFLQQLFISVSHWQQMFIFELSLFSFSKTKLLSEGFRKIPNWNLTKEHREKL